MGETYLDNSATTRVLPEAADAAYRAMTENYGNPSSLHRRGLWAEEMMESARRAVARAMGAEAESLVFTSGGTEANNLAVIGAAMARRRKGDKAVVSAYEHDSVLAAARYLEGQGFSVTYLLPDEHGRITPEAVAGAVDEKTVLVSVMLVNNETGAVNPIDKLVKAAKAKNPDAVFHTDAVQALGKLPLSVKKLGADLVTVTAHKICGPKGVGALWIKKGVRLEARALGGEQEKRLRGGTEAAPLIAAFGVAADHAAAELAQFAGLMSTLREAVSTELLTLPGVVLNSPEDALPAIVNVSVPGIRSEIMLHYLEAREIYVSSGSACAKGGASHVLAAMGYERARIDSALRISFGRENTPEDVARLAEAIKGAQSELCR